VEGRLERCKGAWETRARGSKLHSALLSWYLTGTAGGRRQSEIHISEDWGNWRGASTGDGRVVMWAKLDFASLRVGKS